MMCGALNLFLILDADGINMRLWKYYLIFPHDYHNLSRGVLGDVNSKLGLLFGQDPSLFQIRAAIREVQIYVNAKRGNEGTRDIMGPGSPGRKRRKKKLEPKASDELPAEASEPKTKKQLKVRSWVYIYNEHVSFNFLPFFL